MASYVFTIAQTLYKSNCIVDIRAMNCVGCSIRLKRSTLPVVGGLRQGVSKGFLWEENIENVSCCINGAVFITDTQAVFGGCCVFVLLLIIQLRKRKYHNILKEFLKFSKCPCFLCGRDRDKKRLNMRWTKKHPLNESEDVLQDVIF